jgi:hypothetical protein
MGRLGGAVFVFAGMSCFYPSKLQDDFKGNGEFCRYSIFEFALFKVKEKALKSIFVLVIFAVMSNASVMGRYTCVNKYETTYFTADGSLNPKTTRYTNGIKVGIEVIHEQDDKLYLEVSGNMGTKKLPIVYVKHKFIYALEFTEGGMYTWILFENNKNGRMYLTINKAYNLLLMLPFVSNAVYECH